jgi:hypothetical protein
MCARSAGKKIFTALLEPDGTRLWVIARVPFDLAKTWPVRRGRRRAESTIGQRTHSKDQTSWCAGIAGGDAEGLGQPKPGDDGLKCRLSQLIEHEPSFSRRLKDTAYRLIKQP